MGGSRLPAFQFYTGDWTTDPNLRRCSKAAKGVWIDILCLMSECEDRGVLWTGGKPWSLEEIAAAIGGDMSENVDCINELVDKGVARRNECGAIYSKRMVEDEEVRQERSKAGSKGGSKTQANRQANGVANTQAKRGSPSPSPSPSPSVSSKEDTQGAAGQPVPFGEFQEAWNATPLTAMRSWSTARKKALRARWAQSTWRDEWREALARAAKSEFCRGGGSRNWRADVDWFLRPDTVTKILEGKYDDGGADDGGEKDWTSGVVAPTS